MAGVSRGAPLTRVGTGHNMHIMCNMHIDPTAWPAAPHASRR